MEGKSTFTNYINTLIELKLAQSRLKILRDRKEELWTNLISPKAMKIDLVGGQNMPHYTDATKDYAIAVNTPRPPHNLSINEEIDQLEREVTHLTMVLETMADSVIKLKGIECELFVLIMVNGMKPSDAVNKIAEIHYMSVSNIWQRYYPAVKKEMAEVKRCINESKNNR